jgi:pimeloyl-ACP methyl ester carboxylesterase
VSRASPAADVVLLLHGWPDSVLRFERLFPRLADVTFIAPALPGFPFAAPVPQGGQSSIAMADAIAEAMEEFGFDSYVISAGDVGCDVAEALAARHPDHVSAMHLTDVSQTHYLIDPPTDLNDDERAYLAAGQRWQAGEGGYMHEQSTRPNTLAVGLGDSPAGLAAWIVEKLIGWTDSDGSLTDVFSYDETLTWVTAYWLTGTIGTSFAPYAASGAKRWPRIEIPTVFTIFAKDLVNAPRSFAERFFNVAGWREYDYGGHFAAWENPDDYLWGLQAAVHAGRVDPISRSGT